MTDQLRAAAQALLEVCNGYGCTLETEIEARKDALRAALSAPQPAADERVAQLMRLIDEVGRHVGDAKRIATARAAVESSARALLAAEREDAEMLDWVLEHRARIVKMHDELPVYAHYWDSQGEHHGPDADTPREAIRAAMQKGTP